jgi:hypothetical protein
MKGPGPPLLGRPPSGSRQKMQSPSGWFSSLRTSIAVLHRWPRIISPRSDSSSCRSRSTIVARRASLMPLASATRTRGAWSGYPSVASITSLASRYCTSSPPVLGLTCTTSPEGEEHSTSSPYVKPSASISAATSSETAIVEAVGARYGLPMGYRWEAAARRVMRRPRLYAMAAFMIVVAVTFSRNEWRLGSCIRQSQLQAREARAARVTTLHTIIMGADRVQWTGQAQHSTTGTSSPLE